VAYCPRPEWDQRLVLGVFDGANHPDFSDALPLSLITGQPPSHRLTGQSIDNSRGFRYVRYVGPNNVRCNIAELEFYGYPGEGNNSRIAQITNIPDVVIHTVNGQDITSKTTYIKGIVSFIYDNGAKVYTDSLEIRGRGNVSWDFEKKPYRIKLYNKARVLDNPAEAKNWTLISNHGDKTLMRNLLAFDLSRRLEMPYTPSGRPVNLFLNGEYKGCYQFCDHIDVRENRVDIKEMKPSDVSGENLTGGYLIEIDAYANEEAVWFSSQRNRIPVTIKSPDDDEIVSQQKNYIQNHFNTWENSVFSSSYTNPATGFRKYMDTKTFARHFLVGEFSGNTDTYWSVYMYKQRNKDQFYIGPVWDFDLAYDNDSRTYPVNKPSRTDWIYRSGGSTANGMKEVINRLISDMELYKELRTTYAYYRDWDIITEEKLLKVVDDYALEMEQSQQLNFKRWDIINSQVHMINHNTGSYQGEVDIVKNYIKNRIAWMDTKLDYVPSDVSEIRPVTTENAILLTGITQPVHVFITNLTGQIVHEAQMSKDFGIHLQKGIYLLIVTDHLKHRHTYKGIVH
jgi:hypothetical protein